MDRCCKTGVGPIPQLRVHMGGEMEEQGEALRELGVAAIICVLSIFAALVILFQLNVAAVARHALHPLWLGRSRDLLSRAGLVRGHDGNYRGHWFGRRVGK